MNLVVDAIRLQRGSKFTSLEELEKWAHDHHLDKVLYSELSHKFMCISHKGETMMPAVFEQYYGDVLRYEFRNGDRMETRKWHPSGFEYFDKAYIASEQSDGVHPPLYYRDYCVPAGFYSEERDAYNVAKPFPVFAEETGRDTSHIYAYIEHVAGECAMWLLAWLRAKLLYPTTKTQVVPIIVSRSQGSGKTTFAEVICKGLFGKDNVLVTDQYDAGARFNADYADALIVCQEEKELEDRRNPAGSLKSRATATTIRKEKKGADPIYQESYTDFIVTTNKDVPIKFEGREDQRRFMVMEADEHFTRKESSLADEVFTKLYGFDANFQKKGKPFVEDKELIAQFKHELFTREDIAKIPLRNFPKTAAYKRCYTLPRTNEYTEIEAIMRSLAPFIRQSLLQESVATECRGMKLKEITQHDGAIEYIPAYSNIPATLAVCRPLVFYELQTMKPMPHSTVERALYDCESWLSEDFGIELVHDMEPLPGGFVNVAGRYRTAPAARFRLTDKIKPKKEAQLAAIKEQMDRCAASKEPESAPADTQESESAPKEEAPALQKEEIPAPKKATPAIVTDSKSEPVRKGKRFRVNEFFRPDENGCFETVNELREGVASLKDKTKNVQYMDTFLFESDTPTRVQDLLERKRAAEREPGSRIEAEELYRERLTTALHESTKLFDDCKVCRVVYSGAKSYHLLVRVADAPKTLEEYKWLHSWLCLNLSKKLTFDSSTSDPARLTRSPITKERITEALGLEVRGTQELILEDWSHIYKVKWRTLFDQWKKRPLSKIEKEHGKQMYPTRKEYEDAATALIDGTFWSSSSYNGDRQRYFFPAYRLFRALGWSHDELFKKIIPKGLRGYKKRNDVNYWLSREHCTLIETIDRDIDEWEEMKNESSVNG